MSESAYEKHRHEDPAFPIIFHKDKQVRGQSMFWMHWHESIEILYFVEGEGIVIQEGEDRNITTGEIVVINADSLHNVRAVTESCSYYCLIVDRTFCEGFGVPIGEFFFQEKVQDPQAIELFEKIMREMREKRDYYKQQVKVEALELLLYLMRYYAKRRSKTDMANSHRMELLKKTLRYIQMNFTNPLTVEELASLSGFSRYYFCRVFKEVIGYAPITYVNLLRCENARKLLQSGRFNVSQSAAMSGFANLSYFDRLYKRQFGCLPTAHMTECK